MRNLDLKSKIVLALSVSLVIFLTYIFFRVRTATDVPVVHTLWNLELAALLRTTAKAVQLLGLIAGASTFVNAVKKWRAKEPFIYVPVLQSSFLCTISFVAPDMASHCIPILFGIVLDF